MGIEAKPRVFLSYRRREDKHFIGRIYDRLVAEFGEENVFRDVDSMGGAENFLAAITNRLAESAILLSVIGPEWSVGPAEGRDWVHVELERALERQMLVVPICLDQTPMPSVESLPVAIRGLADVNALRIDGTNHFSSDMTRVTDIIRTEVTARKAAAHARNTLPRALARGPEDQPRADSPKPMPKVARQRGKRWTVVAISTIALLGIGGYGLISSRSGATKEAQNVVTTTIGKSVATTGSLAPPTTQPLVTSTAEATATVPTASAPTTTIRTGGLTPRAAGSSDGSQVGDESSTPPAVVLADSVSPISSSVAPPTVTVTSPPTYPEPAAGNITVSNLGSNSYKFGAPNSSKCQERESWTLTGPTPHSSDSGNIGWHCYSITHVTGPFTLTAGTYTITLTLYGNGKQSTATETFTVA